MAPKFFYDRLGSHLFEAITELPEYYPTRTEAAIFAAHGAEMREGDRHRHGAGRPRRRQLRQGGARCFRCSSRRRYVAVDISVEFLRDALRQVQREHPQIDDRRPRPGLLAPARAAGRAARRASAPVFFYPGSSIGNFTPDEALAFLRRVRASAPAAAAC